MRGPKEANVWKHITVEMMSDEEKRDNVYVRHQPSYRSDALNAFIKKLDRRSDSATGNHAKFERKIGTPTNKVFLRVLKMDCETKYIELK